MISPRRRARELALQGLYQWQIQASTLHDIELSLQEQPHFKQADRLLFQEIVRGVLTHREALDALIQPLLDRELAALSLVEHAVLWMGAFELQHSLHIPYRVIINECIEITKRFGGVDGHKYVNGILDKMAAQLRAQELSQAPARGPRTSS